MRRPNHASRFEGIAKTNLQASSASDTETLQSQVDKAGKKRLSLSGLEILHGRRLIARAARRAGRRTRGDEAGIGESRFGSIASQAVEATPRCMSASPPKRPFGYHLTGGIINLSLRQAR